MKRHESPSLLCRLTPNEVNNATWQLSYPGHFRGETWRHVVHLVYHLAEPRAWTTPVVTMSHISAHASKISQWSGMFHRQLTEGNPSPRFLPMNSSSWSRGWVDGPSTCSDSVGCASVPSSWPWLLLYWSVSQTFQRLGPVTVIFSAKKPVSFSRLIGDCSMDELHQHAVHLRLCGLLWGWSRSHPLVLCSRAVLSGSKAGGHGCRRMFQLDCQLPRWHVLPIRCCKYSSSTSEIYVSFV